MESKCPFCDGEVESHLHALCDCASVQNIWTNFCPSITGRLDFFNHTQVKAWVFYDIKDNKMLEHGISCPLVFGMLYWLIWKSKIEAIFNDKLRDPNAIRRLACHKAKEFYLVCFQVPISDILSTRSILNDNRKPPDANIFKLNVDGSKRRMDRMAFGACLIQDDCGEWMEGFQTSFDSALLFLLRFGPFMKEFCWWKACTWIA